MKLPHVLSFSMAFLATVHATAQPGISSQQLRERRYAEVPATWRQSAVSWHPWLISWRPAPAASAIGFVESGSGWWLVHGGQSNHNWQSISATSCCGSTAVPAALPTFTAMQHERRNAGTYFSLLQETEVRMVADAQQMGAETSPYSAAAPVHPSRQPADIPANTSTANKTLAVRQVSGVIADNSIRQDNVDTLGGDPSDVPSTTSGAGAAGVLLSANYPNPFSLATAIDFILPRSCHVNITIFDISGRQVATLKNEIMTAGSHTVPFEAGELPNGHYFCHLVADDTSITQMLTIIR